MATVAMTLNIVYTITSPTMIYDRHITMIRLDNTVLEISSVLFQDESRKPMTLYFIVFISLSIAASYIITLILLYIVFVQLVYIFIHTSLPPTNS